MRDPLVLGDGARKPLELKRLKPDKNNNQGAKPSLQKENTMIRRTKIEGQQAIKGWHFGDDHHETRDERIADLLVDCKAEVGRRWMAAENVQMEIEKHLENIKTVFHKHNRRVQQFSVYVPRTLLTFLRKADEDNKLFADWVQI